jgi:hypothetical protein
MSLSLLDQLKDLVLKDVLGLVAFGWAVAWGAAQNFIDKLSAPSIVGPGKLDILRYGMDIVTAKDSKAACQAAADGIYNMLLPNFGDVMGSSVSAVTNLINTGDVIGNTGSNSGTSEFSSSFTGNSQSPGNPSLTPYDYEKDREEDL